MDQGKDTAGRFDHLRGALRDYPPLIWSFLYFFCLLTGYYVMRPVRDAVAASNDPAMVFPPAMVEWFAVRGVDLGDFQIQALFTGTFLSMLLLQPVYGALVSRFPRRVFLPVVYLVFIACLFGFYVAFDMDMPGRGGAYFIWVAVFNLFAVSVFWSFMADIYTDPEARRLYGFIAAGGTVGGLLGPEITSRLVNQLGVGNMLLVSAGFLILCLVCILRLGPWARERERQRGSVVEDEAMGGRVLEGLRRIAADPMLRALAFLMFFGVGVGTLLYNEQNAIVREMTAGNPAAAEQATAFFSTIDKWINWVVLVVQVFLTRMLLDPVRRGAAADGAGAGDPGGLLRAVRVAAADAGGSGAGDDPRFGVLAVQAGARNDLHPRRPGGALQGQGGDRHRGLPRRRPGLRLVAQGDGGVRLLGGVRRWRAGRRRLHRQRLAGGEGTGEAARRPALTGGALLNPKTPRGRRLRYSSRHRTVEIPHEGQGRRRAQGWRTAEHRNR